MPDVFGQYAVDDTSDVVVDVVVGEAQPGAIDVRLAQPAGETSLAKGKDALRGVVLGAGSAVRGAALVVGVAVVDLRAETDRTSVTVDVKGGPRPATFSAAAEAAGGGPVHFYFRIRLT